MNNWDGLAFYLFMGFSRFSVLFFFDSFSCFVVPFHPDVNTIFELRFYFVDFGKSVLMEVFFDKMNEFVDLFVGYIISFTKTTTTTARTTFSLMTKI